MTTKQNIESEERVPDIARDHHGRVAGMIKICVMAGNHTLKYFRKSDVQIEAKSDDSPVTVADREAEELARQQLSNEFPEDAIHGEEFPEKSGTSEYRWIIDPIDGTKSFVCGVPLYSTLIALEKNGIPIAGAIYIPATGEMVFAAEGRGCWYRETEKCTWEPSQVSDKKDLKESVFLTSQADLFRERKAGEAFQILEDTCWVSRSWGDGYGYLMVATGRAEVMVDAICNPWDVAAMIPIMQEAGGLFTDWNGQNTHSGGSGVGSNGKVHQAALSILQTREDKQS